MEKPWNTTAVYAHRCEGCGHKIRNKDGHYAVTTGSIAPFGNSTYYHVKCLDPYLISVWLQDGQSVCISQHED